MDKKVIKKIYALVNDGLCNLKEIERALQFFVKPEMFKGQDPPELTNWWSWQAVQKFSQMSIKLKK